MGLPISSALSVPRPALTDPDGSGLLYELKLTNSYGCSSIELLPVHTFRLPKAGSISGPTEGCNDVSYSFLISCNNEVGSWGVTGASGVTIDADGHLIVTGSITEPTTLIITYTVGTGWICGPPSVATHTFTLYPIPTPSPSGINLTWTLPLSWVGKALTATNVNPTGNNTPAQFDLQGRMLTVIDVMPGQAVRFVAAL
jgi:hypothetical protein